MDNRTAIVCCHVVNGKAQPAFAFRTSTETEADSGWQCLCGGEHSMSDAMVVSMDELKRLCPDIDAIKDTPSPCSFSFDNKSGTFKEIPNA